MNDSGFTRYGFVDNGDDALLVIRKDQLEYVKATLIPYFTMMGMILRIDKVCPRIEDVEFCQSHPVRLQDGWRMVRNYPNHIAKDLTNVHGLNTAKLLETWLYAVGSCGLACAKGVPIQESFYRMLCRVGYQHYPKAMLGEMRALRFFSRGMASNAVVTLESRESFWHAFGILPCEQVIIEKHYDSIMSFGSVYELTRGIPSHSLL
jgi:hypothetical protein